MATMLEQKEALWKRSQERAEEQKRLESLRQVAQSEMGEGEEQSTVEITMETEDIETEMDTTIVEQGILPKVKGPAEQQVYERLLTLELNHIQWQYEALSYLTMIVRMNQQARESGGETRAVAQVSPRIWAYLGLQNSLTRHEVEMGMEDPNTSMLARFIAIEKAHKTWMSQRTRARKPSQSPSSSRSQVDRDDWLRTRIRFACSLAEILFLNDYDEDNFLAPGITLFNVFDSDNDVHLKMLQLQELCATCGQTPADELNQDTLILLRTFGFGSDQPKKKLMIYLGTQRNKNAKALQAASNKWTARLGLNELAMRESTK